MISYIKGKIEYVSQEYIIIESNNIGYKVFVSTSTIEKISHQSDFTKVFTFMNVKEDGISLYGFYSMEELDLFNQLISVSGVGPKGALSFLNMFTPSEIIMAIVSEDINTLSKINGVGKKTAQRAILELKDKFKDYDFFAGFATDTETTQSTSANSSKFEAIEALVALGYSKVEANKAVSEVYDETLEVEELLKLSLKKMI